MSGRNGSAFVLLGLLVLAFFCGHRVALAQGQPIPLTDLKGAREVPASRSEIQLSFAPIVKRTAPAVVNVYSRRVNKRQSASPFFDDPFFRRFFGGRGFGVPRQRVQRSLGSGVILKPNGVVVTNNHVINGGNDIQVVLNDGREFSAEVVLTDEKTDLAVLKIDPKGEDLPFLGIHNSDDLEVGDLVLAIGNPFGVGQTVTSGIVSALARTQKGISDFQFFIQTDAAINPGNSGGALISTEGDLVGINTAIFSRSGGSNGIGFAIPSNMVRLVLDSSRFGGRVRRPWLGAQLQQVTPAIADSIGLQPPAGAMVKQLHPASPLNAAGLRSGDVVLAIDGHKVKTPQELTYRFATKGVGGKVALTYFRGGGSANVTVPLISPPEIPKRNQQVLSGPNPFSGATVANLSPALADSLRIDPALEGIIILDPGRDEAAYAGFKRGDIILSVEGRRIKRLSDMKPLLQRPRQNWSLSVRRSGRLINTTIRG